MAETYLYSTRENNKQLKDDVKAAGGVVKFDRERGAYALQTGDLSKEAIAELKGKLSNYIGDAARKAWKTDRTAMLADSPTEKLRGQAKAREATTTEPGPDKSKVVSDQGITVYPAISQKDDFRKLVIETGSESKYHKPRGDVGAHYKVVTASPEKFAQFQGPEAEARFKQEFAELQATGGKRENVNSPTEVARDAARKLNGRAFMVQYQERGFRLADAQANPGNHQKQLNEMRLASKAQLVEVARVSRALLEPLRTKEAQMRADAAGIPVEQVKAMSWDQQKQVGAKDGKPIGLVGDEYALATQLARGLKAIDTELRAQGVGVEKPQRAQDQGKGQAAEKPQAKPVAAEQAAGNDLDVIAAMAAARKDRGR